MPRIRDEAKYQEQREFILKEALKLFREYGYQGTRIEEVARSAGMTKAAVYYYFPTKADLLIESCRSVVDSGLEQIRKIEKDESLTAPKRLRMFVRQHLETLEANVEAWSVIFEDVRISQEAGAKPLREAQRKFGQTLERIITKGMADGEFRSMNPQIGCQWDSRDV